MDVVLNLFIFALGFVFIVKGGDLFVDSSIQIAGYFRLPKILVGGTLVSLATTAPELFVSVTASVMKDSGIALGNALGSAIANIGLIVGVAVWVSPLIIKAKQFRPRALIMAGAAVLVMVLSFNLYLPRWAGWMLLAYAAGYLYFDYLKIKKGPQDTQNENSNFEGSIRKSWLIFACGAALVLLGSRFLVMSAVEIAEFIGVPSIVIGLSVVAIGTSLPELVTAVTASRKGEGDLMLGNILGANTLNLALIVGMSGAIHPLALTESTRNFSFVSLSVFIVLLIAFIFRDRTMKRGEGAVFLVLYVLYVAGLTLIQ